MTILDFAALLLAPPTALHTAEIIRKIARGTHTTLVNLHSA